MQFIRASHGKVSHNSNPFQQHFKRTWEIEVWGGARPIDRLLEVWYIRCASRHCGLKIRVFFVTLWHKETKLNFERRNDENV